MFLARLRGVGGFEKLLVIKQIKPELARDAKFVELFVREANTLVALSHPHIVQVYELGSADGSYFLSMEYVEGATITRILDDGALAPALAAHLASQICEALDYAYSRFGILHRDITPRNIIVDRAGHGRLLDFGIAGSAHEHSGELFGSQGYMSPEQASGASVGPESDVFSLGCVLFEMLTRSQVMAPGSHDDTDESARGLAQRLEHVPATLRDLVCRMLAKEPQERPLSPEVARTLRGFLAQTRPEGVLSEMQGRVETARSHQPALAKSQSEHDDAPHTARIEAQSIATSPILTELIRSASGLAVPMPEKPSTKVPDAPGVSPERPSLEGADRPVETRRIRAASPETGLDSGARWTRMMFKAWPTLAVLSLVAAFGLAFRRAEKRAEEHTERASAVEALAGDVAPDAPIAPPVQAEAPKEAASSEQTAAEPALRASDATKPDATQPAEPGESGEVDDEKRAQLSINAQPWAEVSIDGKPVGTTPLRHLKLRPGAHRIRLHCPPLGREAELHVQLDAKASARIVVDLQQNPARTFLDGAKEVR